MSKNNESAAEKLERMLDQFISNEDLVTLDMFPTMQSIVDYFNTLDHYDAESMLDIRSAIEMGSDPKTYYKLISKHGLQLRKHRCSLSAAQMN
jgi:hypothetical protein